MHLAKKGYAITIHFHKSKKQALQLQKTIKKQGGKANCVQANLNLEKEIENLINKANKKFGKITFLVNNSSNF